MAKKEKAKSEKEKISGKMSFSELLNKYPDSATILMNHGMSCIGCPMAMQENLETGARAHGIDIKNLVEELNKKFAKPKKENKK